MSNDIVARLRAYAYLDDTDYKQWVYREAADEIERMRDALRRISHAPRGKVYCADGHEEAVLIARAALGEATDDAAT
jgi:hypothetical protein